MAGKYTPKTGVYAGREFASYRQYLNTKSRDEGYSNFNQRVKARKELKTLEDELELSHTTKTLRNKTKVDIYTSDNLGAILEYASKLAPNYIVTITVKTENSLGTSKQVRNYVGYSTLLNQTKVSLFNKMLEDGRLQEIIADKLGDVDNFMDIVLVVKR